MGLFNLFNKNVEKEIMGSPVSKFFADIYTLSTEKHINGMIPFFNNFMANSSTLDSEVAGSMGAMAFNKSSIDHIIQEIFRYYYYQFNEYVFPQIKNKSDIDYQLFQKNFSNEVYKQLNSSDNYKSFLYENWDLDDSIEDLLNDMKSEMLDEDKSNPQFYKEILKYYYPNNRGPLLEKPVEIMIPYIQSSDLIVSNPPDTKTNVDTLAYFFAVIFWNLKCLPENYKYMDREYEQYNSNYFNELLNLMIDNTYNSLSIQAVVKQSL